MKKFLIFLCFCVSFVSRSGCAGTEVYFRSSALEQAINELVPAEKRQAAVDAYQKYMNNGKISVINFYKVCDAAGFKIENRDGKADCSRLLDAAKGGSAGTPNETNCKTVFDGLWAYNSDTKKYACVGKDGKVLNYKNACNAMSGALSGAKAGKSLTNKAFDNSGTCDIRFSQVYTQYSVAKSLVQNAFPEYNLSCKNRKTTEKSGDNYLYCSGGGKPFTFKFKSFGNVMNDGVVGKAQNLTDKLPVGFTRWIAKAQIAIVRGIENLALKIDDRRDVERANIAEMLCRAVDSNYQAVDFGDGSSVCLRVNTDNDFIRPHTDKCNKIGSLGQKIGGGYNSGYGEKTLTNKNGVVESYDTFCSIVGGRTEKDKLKNEYGAPIDNWVFKDLYLRNTEEVVQKVRNYVRGQIGNSATVTCDSASKRFFNDKALFGLIDTDKKDVITCRINGKQVDFIFGSLSTKSSMDLKDGLGGLDCIVSGGTYDGHQCLFLNEKNCKDLANTLEQTCPECKAPVWTENGCSLPDSNVVSTIERNIKIVKAGTMTAVGVALVLVPGAQGGSVLAFTSVAETVYSIGAITFIAGTAVSFGADVIINTWVYKNFANKANTCYDETCARRIIKEMGQEILGYKGDFSEAEQNATLKLMEHLFNLIPENSSFWLEIVQNEDVFDPIKCEFKAKKGFWQKARTAGNVMQIVGGALMTSGALAQKVSKVYHIGKAGRGQSYLIRTDYVPGNTNFKHVSPDKWDAILRGADPDVANLVKNGMNSGGRSFSLPKGSRYIKDAELIILPNGKQISTVIKTPGISGDLKTLRILIGIAETSLAAVVGVTGNMYTKVSDGFKLPICMDNDAPDGVVEIIDIVIEDPDEDNNVTPKKPEKKPIKKSCKNEFIEKLKRDYSCSGTCKDEFDNSDAVFCGIHVITTQELAQIHDNNSAVSYTGTGDLRVRVLSNQDGALSDVFDASKTTLTNFWFSDCYCSKIPVGSISSRNLGEIEQMPTEEKTPIVVDKEAPEDIDAPELTTLELRNMCIKSGGKIRGSNRCGCPGRHLKRSDDKRSCVCEKGYELDQSSLECVEIKVDVAAMAEAAKKYLF